jgi:hypothetical protein
MRVHISLLALEMPENYVYAVSSHYPRTVGLNVIKILMGPMLFCPTYYTLFVTEHRL